MRDNYVTGTLYLNEFSGFVPEKLKQIALLIMRRFTIDGIWDGMYICNSIASLNEIGDGHGAFFSDEITNARRTAESLQHAYGCNIGKDDVDELEEIIKTRKLDKKKARKGLIGHIVKCRSALENGDCREKYLERSIYQANLNLAWLDRQGVM